jgi:hypothetical protein
MRFRSADDCLQRPVEDLAGNRPNRLRVPGPGNRFQVALERQLGEQDNHDAESWMGTPDSRCRLGEKLVPRQKTVESGLRRCGDQVTIAECVPAAIVSRVTVDLLTPEQPDEMNVEVGVKQPHGKSRRTPMRPLELREAPVVEMLPGMPH